MQTNIQPAFASAVPPASAAAMEERVIHGPPDSKAVVRRMVNRLNDASNAGFEKMLAVARQLPPEAFDALFDPETIELMLNPDGRVFQEKLGCEMEHICDMEESRAMEFIRQIAGCLDTTVTAGNPILEGILPLDGSRFEGLLPPAAEHPTFSIRKRAVRVFTLADYVADGIITETQRECIHRAVLDRKNILILGGTGSGKTTFGNAVLNEITLSSPNARQIIIEDTPELNSTAFNKVYLHVSPGASMTDLLAATLRMRPDRIIVGEVRGPAAFDLLQAWNTGHPGGMATLHANTCLTGLRRLKSLVSQHEYAPRDIEPDIALAVNVMVNIAREDGGRRVREIVEIGDYDPGCSENYGYRLETLRA
jgi:type IV secretion system protein VirB11